MQDHKPEPTQEYRSNLGSLTPSTDFSPIHKTVLFSKPHFISQPFHYKKCGTSKDQRKQVNDISLLSPFITLGMGI